MFKKAFRYSVIPIAFSLIPLGNPGVAHAQPCPDSSTSYFVQYKTARADQVKCGFPAFTNDDLPRLHLYHTQISKENWDINYDHSFSQTDTTYKLEGCDDWYVSYGPGSVTDTHTEGKHATFTEQQPGPVCTPYSSTYSGTYTLSTVFSDTRPQGGYACDGFTANCDTNTLQTEDISESPVQDPATGAWQWAGQRRFTDYVAGCHPLINQDSGWIAESGAPDFEGVLIALTRKHKEWAPDETVQDPPTGSRTIDLSDEYTDDELRANIMASMPAYGTWYIPSGQPGEVFATTAYSVIDGTHTKATSWFPPGEQAELQKMEYQIGVSSSDATRSYQVEWDLVTWDTTTGQIDSEHHSCDLGTGNPNGTLLSPVQEVMPPLLGPEL